MTGPRRRTCPDVRLALLFPLASLMALATPATSERATYDYDQAGRLLSVSYDTGVSITYEWDENGNLLRREITGSQDRTVFVDDFESGDLSAWTLVRP